MQLLRHPSQVGCYLVALQQKSQASTSQGELELMMQVLGQYYSSLLKCVLKEICQLEVQLINVKLQNNVFLKFSF